MTDYQALLNEIIAAAETEEKEGRISHDTATLVVSMAAMTAFITKALEDLK